MGRARRTTGNSASKQRMSQCMVKKPRIHVGFNRTGMMTYIKSKTYHHRYCVILTTRNDVPTYYLNKTIII